MVPVNGIKKVFSELSEALGIDIVREDQSRLSITKKLDYPFGSYKILIDTNEPSISNITSTGVSLEDPHIKLVSTYKTAIILVSLTFYDKEDVATLYDYAQDALDWFTSLDGQDILTQYEMVLASEQIAVEDSTVFLDTYYETKIGFDLHFIYTYRHEEEIHRIQTIRLTPEVDDVEDAEIVYTAQDI
jgi:DNA-binding protein Fis